jgi:predicted Zn-dependent protease
MAPVIALAGCSVNPATGEPQIALVGETTEVRLGGDAAEQAKASLGVYADAGLQPYVQQVGQKLAAISERPELSWEFVVLDDSTVNAFALPGGHVFLTRGILAYFNSEAELAAVLGHEIGYVTGRHAVEQMSKAQLAQLGLGAGTVLSPNVWGLQSVIG